MARDEHVEPAERLDRRLEAAAEVGAIGEVGPDRDPADAVGRLVGRRRAPEHRDPCARAGECLRDPEPDAAATARDERAPPREVEQRSVVRGRAAAGAEVSHRPWRGTAHRARRYST